MFETQKETVPQREERLMRWWEKHRIFETSVDHRRGSNVFAFYDGPPFATGLPHYGHILAGVIKDVVLRYKTMQGFYVPRRFGWDCHGLPVENEIEQTYGIAKNGSVEDFGIAKFNEACRSIVLRYTKQWEKTIARMGRWIDYQHAYKTMDLPFMETVWWVFGSLWEKGLIYQGFKVMPFSTQLKTPLSNFEANLNYREIDDPSIVVTFPLCDDPHTSLLVWTTTPWTLPSNLAVIVNRFISYVKIRDRQTHQHYVIAKKRLSAYFKEKDRCEILDTFDGSALKGMKYRPLFDYFVQSVSPKAFTILEDRFVEEEDGTGIVHAAPAFGEADFYVCKKEGIAPVCPVDERGRFTSEVPDYERQYVKDADKGIIRRLKQQKRLFHHGHIRHRYPFCWRSDTPLIYRAVHTWFVNVERIKGQIIEKSKQIDWIPTHIKEGRFGKWLAHARDWAISRNRYWGTPMPIWRSHAGDVIVIKSVEDLEKRTGEKISDLHRHHIDSLTFKEKGELYKRVPEVFDCWFESGSMPYAQNHFPFENKRKTMDSFPADFISEGLDQTRCWFYVLNILSVALFERPAFKHVIVNGIVLAEDGAKMSKRLRNYPDPNLIFDKYGADAVRLYLLKGPAVRAEDLRFSEKGIQIVLRQFLIPLWNAYLFLATYAKIYHWKPQQSPSHPQSDMDRWILSLLNTLIKEVQSAIDGYVLNRAIDPFFHFTGQLTNWYIRRCRSRFWSDDNTLDRQEAFQTLYTVLINFSKIIAPFVPFISDAIYQGLRTDRQIESVHLTDFPLYREEIRDAQLEKKMETVQRAVSMGHALRKQNKVKVRQPLGKAHLISTDPSILALLEEQQLLVKEELNVKTLEFHSDESSFVLLTIKPNFRTLGKRLGPLIQHMKEALKKLGVEQVQALAEGADLTLTLGDEVVSIDREDVEIERHVKEGLIAATESQITVALDITMTQELLDEGLMREIINKLNTQRRDQGFEVTDRIQVKIDSTPRVRSCFEKFHDVIIHEVLATHVHFEKTTDGTHWDLNGEKATIDIQKISK